MFVVQACVFADDGDALYRLHDPCTALGSAPGVFAVDCDVFHRDFLKLALECDVLIFPYLTIWELFPLIEERRKQGKVSIFETNDFYDDLHPWNPIAPAWLDPDVSITHRALIRHADAIQTSSSYLEKHWAPIARTTALFENNLREVHPLHPSTDRPLTVGWGGSAGHLADWYDVTPTLQKWFNRHPEARCAVMTYRHAARYLQLPPERYEFRDFGSLSQYQDFLRSLDIGVVPLLPSPYNFGRSDVKFLEYAAHGVVGVYARRGPYLNSIQHGETGLLYDNYDELVEHLDHLARDLEFRNGIRQRAYDYVRDNRLLEKNVAKRVEFYRQLLGRPTSDAPPAALSKYVPDSVNAYQLKRGTFEDRYFSLLSLKSSETIVRDLEELLKEAPDYAYGYQTLARCLNDLKKPADALAVVERARHLQPISPTLSLEEGRAQFMAGNLSGALAIFDAMVTTTPQFLPGWQVLLRALRAPSLNRERIDSIRSAVVSHNRESYHLRLLSIALANDSRRAREEMMTLLRDLSEMASSYQLLKAHKSVVPLVIEIATNARNLSDAGELLELAESVFPSSFALKDKRAIVLRAQGHHDISNRLLGELAEMRRIALTYTEEVPPQSDSHLSWMVGEYFNGLSVK